MKVSLLVRIEYVGTGNPRWTLDESQPASNYIWLIVVEHIWRLNVIDVKVPILSLVI